MPNQPANPEKTVRLAREANALRANLAKRKLQARGRSEKEYPEKLSRRAEAPPVKA